MKTALLPLVGFILLSTPLAASAQQFGDFTYTSDGSVATITGYTGSGGAVTIPATITGLPVTAIGSSAFYNKSSLTSVTIPDSVTSIGNGAFEYCTRMTSVTNGNGVTSIGSYAFDNCTNLTWVTIGNSVTNIGSNAFDYCLRLTSAKIPSSVIHIGGYAFRNCIRLTSATIPSSVTSIGNSAFGGCGSMTNVTIGNGVTSIGSIAFYNCLNLASVTIPDSVISIGVYAFENCISLSDVTIGSRVSSIGSVAFRGCTSLIGVYFKGNAPSLGGSDLFDGAHIATVYYLPGTTGWDATFGGGPTALWVLPYPLILNNDSRIGVQTNGFSFVISWATNIPVVVEAATNLANDMWVPLQSLNLNNGAFHFSDPDWTNYPARFYRIRSP